MTESLKILWASEALNYATGYSTVSRHLVERWEAKGHEVHSLGWFGTGEPHPYSKKNKKTGKWELTSIMQHAGENSIGCSKTYDGKKSIFGKKLDEIKPDVVSSLVDIWFTETMASETNKRKLPYVNYFPLDGEPFPPNWLGLMRESDRVLAMSKWGQAKMNEQLDFTYGITKDIDYVPHGVDTDHFYRMKDRSGIEEVKRLNKWEDKFIVGFVGKNMSRKMIPRLIKAFKLFHDKHPDSLLLLNIGNPLHSDYGINLPQLITQLGLTKDVLSYGNPTSHNEGVSIEKLNILYNMFDVHATMTSGEGFGLTTIESMATGTPNVIVDYTTASELVGEDGWLIPPIAYVEGQFGVLRALGDVPKFADALEDAYLNRDVLEKKGRAGEKRVKKDFNWDNIADDYLAVLKKSMDNFEPWEKRYGGKYDLSKLRRKIRPKKRQQKR